MEITQRSYGVLPTGRQATHYSITNSSGLSLSMIDYGAIITSVSVPDRRGVAQNVTLGFPNLEGYLQDCMSLGATVGRFCNRIGGGRFELDGRTYTLAINNPPNHLHGGNVGFNRALWRTEIIEEPGQTTLRFKHVSPDGDEGYPGNLTVMADYSLSASNQLGIHFQATTDKPTILNLTNHAYWNLAGVGGEVGTGGASRIYDQILRIPASQYLVKDEGNCPTGELAEVADTPFDFTHAKPIGRDLQQVGRDPTGYDHCYALAPGEKGGTELRLASEASDPVSGRSMRVETTQPGLQLYTSNYLDGGPGCNGFGKHEAFCLETQNYPDAINHANFPSPVLRPGEVYRQRTVHSFQW